MDILPKLSAFLRPHITEGAKIILWFFLFASLVVFMLHSVISVAYPYSLDYGEAPLIDQAMRIAAGENIYRPNINTPPYTIANYPPFYVLSLVPLLDWFNTPFTVGRIISVIATLLSTIFIGLTIQTINNDRLGALTAAAFFLASPYVVQWSGRARIDCLALAFATASIFVFVRWPRERWAWLLGGILLVAAAYTRQSYALAAPLAVFVWLWSHNKRRAIELGLLVGGVGLALFLLINGLTRGGFYYNIITANVNEFSWSRLGDQMQRLWSDNWIILLMGVLFLGIGWRSQKSWPILAPFFVGAFVSGLTIGKIGSNINYFLELSAALALIAGAIFAWSRPYPWRSSGAIILIAIQIGILLQSSMVENVDWILSQRQIDISNLQFLEQEVLKMDDPVLADENMGMLTANGRPIYIQPFEVTQLANAGMWDQKPFLDEIAAQKFDGILIHHFGTWEVYKERWSPQMLAAIDHFYRPVKTLAGTVIYIPQAETEIANIPAPSQAVGNVAGPIWEGTPTGIGSSGFLAEPWIATNPTNPDHLVAIATRASKHNCELPNCKVELAFYDSNDGGETWQERAALNRPQQIMYRGLVTFDSAGDLYIMGLRGDFIVLEKVTESGDYQPSSSSFVEVTRSQVTARPWLRVDPQTDEIFLTLDAQEEGLRFVTPSLRRSQDGLTWSTTVRADQHVSGSDIMTPRATGPDDIQILFGDGNTVTLVWVWNAAPWTWPRTVWMANSSDGGNSFGEPTPIAKTWGPINTASANGQFAIVYRTGERRTQQLAVATSKDHGRTWTSTIASGDVPLNFDVEKGPGISMSSDGVIDLVFYAHDSDSLDCVLDIQSWQQTLPGGRIDPCEYNVFYSFSRDGGTTYSEPIQLNSDIIRGEDFAQFESSSYLGSHLGIASGENFAYPIWIGTPQNAQTQIYTARIER